ncbi:hypothetical protein CF336_g6546 [Tilletia laevis]|nr:hypothetical protein CF336_g6546 [Tilletia laevis]
MVFRPILPGPRKAAHADDTVKELEHQVQLAVAGKAKTYFDSQKASGVKDAMVEEVTDILFELRKILSGRAPNHPRAPSRKPSKQAILKEVRVEADSLLAGPRHNALLASDLGAFGVHSHSPIEVLHTLWLGPVKYLGLASIKMVDKDVLRTRLEALNTDGLDCGTSLCAKYLLDHVASLTSKECKLLAQSMPAALPPLVVNRHAPQRLQRA